MINKIRLNNAQWERLLALSAGAAGDISSGIKPPAKTSPRLISYGLVKVDPAGGERLTELGLQRLNQGR